MNRGRLLTCGATLVTVPLLALGALTPATGSATPAPALDHRSGAGAGEPRSTDVPIATPKGQLSAYVVNARPSANLREVRRDVRRAHGVVVQAWPEISVLVVQSRSAGFRAGVTRRAGDALASVGATRTAAVGEGPPQISATGSSQLADVEGYRPPADPREDEQWDMEEIGADQAHLISSGSAEVLVGILDSGIDDDHPDLADNLDRRASIDCTDSGVPRTGARHWAPTSSDHGTHVAGTVAAARNGVGVVGVAPGVRLASVKVVNDDGLIYPEYAVCGFMWAGLQGMDVTNNSYYVDPFAYYCGDRPDQAAAMTAVRRAVRWSTRQGVVHAAAAGNAATDLAHVTTDGASPNDSRPVDRTINDGCRVLPGELPGVVTVSAYDRQRRLAGFSNRGLGVIDVAAPGVDILSTIVEGDGWGTKDGTSMATPHAAGVLALLASTHTDWTPAQLRSALYEQADPIACAPPAGDQGPACEGPDRLNSYAGHGMVDAAAAVQP